METEPLAKYKSRIAGKNADVAIYRDRIEWSVTKLGRSRSHSAEMLPMRNVSSVTSKKSGFGHQEIVLVASGNTVEFRLLSPEADKAKDILHRLMLGEDVQPVAAPVAAAPAAETPAIPPPPAPPVQAPPVTPAGWHADPHGRHEHRYWDGTTWTENVSDAGVATVDPAG